MQNISVAELKEQVSKLWSESKKGEQEAIDLIKACYGHLRLNWGIRYTRLADDTEVTRYLLNALVRTGADDDTRREYLINKFKVNTSPNATPLLDISKGKLHSRFIDVADLYDLIDNIESHDTIFINGETTVL